MADLKIDDAVLDTEVTGGELIPASDGGTPKAIATEKIKDFVLKRIAALSSAEKVDTENDGVYILKGGELKPVSAAVLAGAVLDYAFALSPIASITGNETVTVKDSTVKKTLSLDMLKTWMQEGTVSAEEISAAVQSIQSKVDKEEGKGLSDENFTLAEKQKLEGLVSNAQADWEQTDDTAPSFIRNKPTIPEGVTVDQSLDEASSNPIANNVVALMFKDLMGPESVKYFLNFTQFKRFITDKSDPTYKELRVALFSATQKSDGKARQLLIFIPDIEKQDLWFMTEAQFYMGNIDNYN